MSTEEGLHLAERLSALFMECSARTRHNIHRAFDELVRKVSSCFLIKITCMTDFSNAGIERQAAHDIFRERDNRHSGGRRDGRGQHRLLVVLSIAQLKS